MIYLLLQINSSRINSTTVKKCSSKNVMVIVALVGTLCSGESLVESILVKNGFISINVANFLNYNSVRCPYSRLHELFSCIQRCDSTHLANNQQDIPQMNKDSIVGSLNFSLPEIDLHESRNLRIKLLERHLLEYYAYNIVIMGVSHVSDLLSFSSRPFSFIIGVDAPISKRYQRWKEKVKSWTPDPSVEVFLALDHERNFGCQQCLTFLKTLTPMKEKIPSVSQESDMTNDSLKSFHFNPPLASVYHCLSRADVVLFNSSDKVELMIQNMADLNITSPSLLRPDYDAYFMQLAFETARRSNCLRRAVGAVVTINNKVIATGYNGTPTGCKNCLSGGCSRCSQSLIHRGEQLESCICVHAEANALLQAGLPRTRTGYLYVTCFPCVSCAKLIVQAEIKRLVYFSPYDNSSQTIKLLQSTGIVVKKHQMTFRKNIAEFLCPNTLFV